MGIPTKATSGTGAGSHFIISEGYISAGQASLLKIQKDDMTLQQIQRELNNDYLKEQQETVKANAKAAQASADADAHTDMMDCWDHTAQGGLSAVNIGASAYQQKTLNKQLEEPQAKLENAKQFETSFKNAAPAARTMSDESFQAKMNNDPRFKELAMGGGDLEMQPGDEERIQHIKANEQASAALTKHINQTKTDAITEQNSAITSFQSTQQQTSMVFNILTQAEQAGISAKKAEIAADEKGPAEQMKVTAQMAAQNIDSALNSGLTTASTYDQQAAQINQAREKLAGNGQG